MNTLVNTTVLSNFASTQCLDLLRQALTWRIPLSGTIGVLLLAIRDRRLTIERGNVLLREMVVRANYRTPTMDLGEILRLSDQPSAT